MKTCKQCNRKLDESNFRPVKSRSTGIRKSTPGTRSLCKSCECLNMQAHTINKQLEAGTPVDQNKLVALKQHYAMLVGAGYPIITAAARRFVALTMPAIQQETPDTGKSTIDAYSDMAVLYKHVAMVKNREYASFDEADEVHTTLVDALRKAGLYEEVNNMMDEWFEEGT